MYDTIENQNCRLGPNLTGSSRKSLLNRLFYKTHIVHILQILQLVDKHIIDNLFNKFLIISVIFL